MHKQQVLNCRLYPNVFWIDGTYCTNEYDMPLAHAVGANAQNKTFSAAFCFMQKNMISQQHHEWFFRYFRYYAFYHIMDTDTPPTYAELCIPQFFAGKALAVSNLPSTFLMDRDLATIKGFKVVFADTTTTYQICCWHIDKDVESYCTRAFQDGSADKDAWREEYDQFEAMWLSLRKSTSVEAYSANLTSLEKSFNDTEHGQKCIKYMQKEWLPHKDHFVVAWCKENFNAGNWWTSRCEGAHKSVKDFLPDKKGTLSETVPKFEKYLQEQTNTMSEAELADTAKNPSHLIRNPLYQQVLGSLVSKYGLNLANEQERLYKQSVFKNISLQVPMKTCTGVFKKTTGVPCCHDIKTLCESNSPLTLDMFHPQWHLPRRALTVGDQRQRIFEPNRFQKSSNSRTQPAHALKRGGGRRVSHRFPSRFETTRIEVALKDNARIDAAEDATTEAARKKPRES